MSNIFKLGVFTLFTAFVLGFILCGESQAAPYIPDEQGGREVGRVMYNGKGGTKYVSTVPKPRPKPRPAPKPPVKKAPAPKPVSQADVQAMVRKEVKAELEKAKKPTVASVGKAAAIGSMAGGLGGAGAGACFGGPLGAVVGGGAGMVEGAIIGAVVELYKDL